MTLTEDFERSFAERRRALETELAAEAKRRAERAAREQYETEVKAMKEALAAKEGVLSSLRNGELELRRLLREAEQAPEPGDRIPACCLTEGGVRHDRPGGAKQTKNWQPAWIQKLKDDQRWDE